MSKQVQPVRLGIKIAYGLLAAGVIASLLLWDWRLAVAGILIFLITPVISAPTKPHEVRRLGAKIARVRRLADRWERDAGPTSYNTTTAGTIWMQLRYELDLDEPEWPKDPMS